LAGLCLHVALSAEVSSSDVIVLAEPEAWDELTTKGPWLLELYALQYNLVPSE